MISFIVRLRFAPEDRSAIAEVLRQLTTESRREEGCITYIPHMQDDNPDSVIIYEQYRDEQALAAHRESEHFRKYAVGGLYQKMLDRAVENLSALI